MIRKKCVPLHSLSLKNRAQGDKIKRSLRRFHKTERVVQEASDVFDITWVICQTVNYKIEIGAFELQYFGYDRP